MISLFVPARGVRVALLVAVLGLGGMTRSVADTAALPGPLPEDLFPQLKAILNAAVTQSPQMLSRNIELAQMEGNYYVARSQLLPSLSTNVSYNISDAAVSSNTDVTSRSSGLFYSASLNQTLFRWGTAKAGADAGKIQWFISKKNYREAYRTLILTLRSQFLNLAVKKMSLRNATFDRDETGNLVALQEESLRSGRISQSEILPSRLRLEELSLFVERAAEDLANSKRIFMRTAGLQALGDDVIPDDIPVPEFDPTKVNPMLQKFLGVGWEEDLIVQSNREWIKVADLNYKVAKYRLYPMLGFGASISQSNSTNASENFVSQVGVLSKYIGVSASWSIFDGFATRGAKMSALANKRYYERQLQNHIDGLLDQARSLERQVSFSYRAMNLAAARKSIVDSSLQTAQDELSRGLTSQTAVQATLGSQYQSQLSLLVQKTDFLARWSEFVSTIGQDPLVKALPAK